MNKVILYGYAGKDADLKSLSGGNSVSRFSLATNSYHKDQNGNKIEETDWHNIVCWNKLADKMSLFIKKGTPLIVEGTIKYRSYETPEGEKKNFTEIVAYNIYFAGKAEAKQEKPVAVADIKPQSNIGGKQTLGEFYGEMPGYVNDGSVPDGEDVPF